MLTELEKSFSNLVDVYHKYSEAKGNHHALYRDDLDKLLTTECPQYLKNKDAKSIFERLDINEDKAINFEEFIVLVIKMGLEVHRAGHKE
ncbi:protein S100-A8-like [Acomys russatus]|uniref:protein S100-A8-like n=1 Tax=Acomys russatus TaxID=60746 RepID=UPI0021E24442|nr:protein S100-A8-like [Acomys russatus]